MTQLPAGNMLNVNATPDQVPDSELPAEVDSSGLTAAVRQRLDGEVQSAGNANQVVAGLRRHIAELDAQIAASSEHVDSAIQAERALCVAQISYLEEHHGADPMSGFDEATAHESAPMASNTMSRGRSMTASSTRRARTYDVGR